MMSDIDGVLRPAPDIPILMVHDVGHAVAIATALIAGGLLVIQAKLRTPPAIAVTKVMAPVGGAVADAGLPLEFACNRRRDGGRYAHPLALVNLIDGLPGEASQVPFPPWNAHAGNKMRDLDPRPAALLGRSCSATEGTPALMGRLARSYATLPFSPIRPFSSSFTSSLTVASTQINEH